MGFPPLIVEEKATPFKWRQIILCRASLKPASRQSVLFLVLLPRGRGRWEKKKQCSNVLVAFH